jgi:hypothetical protein
VLKVSPANSAISIATWMTKEREVKISNLGLSIRNNPIVKRDSINTVIIVLN